MMAFLMRRNLLCIGLALAVAAGLVGCARPALSSHATENPHIAYERLNCHQTVDRHQTQVRGGAAGPGGPAGGEAALSEPGRAR